MKQNPLTLSLVILIIILQFSCSEDKAKETKSAESPPQKEIEIPEPKIEYGLMIDSFEVVIDTVKRDQTLSHVLLPHGINQAEINEADVKSKDSLVSLKYIAEGNKYCVLYPLNDTSKASYCVYEKNPVEYIVFDFTKGVSVYKGAKPVDIKRRDEAGVISSSLWNSFIERGVAPELVMRVVNIYQWSVDFFSVQPGDYYRVIYDERFVDGKRIGSGKIHALEFHTYDSSLFAIPFEKDTIKGYFDIEGGSMRKAILKAPLDYIRISSHFSHNRLHPILGYRRPHLGVDYAAPYGTPVVSVGDGIVTFAAYSGGAGKLIKVKHNDHMITYYMHLQRISVKSGERVFQGQKIGEVGSTGLSTGPHLDYRIQINGKFVDPVTLDVPSADPLPEFYLEEYAALRDSLMKILRIIPIPEAVATDTIIRDTVEFIAH